MLKFKGSGGLQELTHPSPSPGPGPGPGPGPTAQHQHQPPLSPRAGCRSCARSSTRHLSTSASSVLWRATRKASESSSCAPRERPLEKYYVCSFRSKCSRRGRPSTCACARSFLTYSGTNAGGMAKGRSAGHKGDVVALLGQSHLQINADGDRDEFTQEEVADRIKKSSGANYDLGSNDGGGNYTTQAPLYTIYLLRLYSLRLYSQRLYSLRLYSLRLCLRWQCHLRVPGGRDRQGGGRQVPRAREGDDHRARQVRDLCSAQGDPDRPRGAADGGVSHGLTLTLYPYTKPNPNPSRLPLPLPLALPTTCPSYYSPTT